ncbi:helix-turn-helix transcriptional regulator [Pseudonocardia sp. GCM10023141]|uniref:helix-turn-helix transcriptional regulator n=1 Tax=Pseudonocardia sp. GCM10023141 TaxID=3252653 RepID=UPI003605D9E3
MISEATRRRRTHEALAVASRVRLVDALRAADGPRSAHELAAECGLHVTTVRFHLEILGSAGLVRSRPEATGGRGRPRLVYSPAAAADPGTGYELLAMMLAQSWGDTASERAERAERAGRAAATTQPLAPLVPHAAPAPAPVLSMEAAVAEVADTFAELGFEPEVAPVEAGLQIRLHACPFRAVATAHPEVVCSLHLGLIRGALEELGGSATAAGLEPFVEPDLCVAHIVATAETSAR